MKTVEFVIPSATLDTGAYIQLEISKLYNEKTSTQAIPKRYQPNELLIYNYTGSVVWVSPLTFEELEQELDINLDPKQDFFDGIRVPNEQILMYDKLTPVDVLVIRATAGSVAADLIITGIGYAYRGSQRNF